MYNLTCWVLLLIGRAYEVFCRLQISGQRGKARCLCLSELNSTSKQIRPTFMEFNLIQRPTFVKVLYERLLGACAVRRILSALHRIISGYSPGGLSIAIHLAINPISPDFRIIWTLNPPTHPNPSHPRSSFSVFVQSFLWKTKNVLLYVVCNAAGRGTTNRKVTLLASIERDSRRVKKYMV